MLAVTSDIDEGKTGPGLWANIHKKRERIKHGSGEHMRKPGSKGAPTAANFKAAKAGSVKEEALNEFDATEFQQRYKLYMGDHLVYTSADEEDAIGYAEEMMRDDPRTVRDVWTLKDINGKTVWELNQTADDIDAYHRSKKFQFVNKDTGDTKPFNLEEELQKLDDAKYHGRTVPLNKPMKGDVKKSKVYVKDPKTGNIKKVNFGDPNMRIKKNSPGHRKSFRARHHCENPGPKTKARYWSCRAW